MATPNGILSSVTLSTYDALLYIICNYKLCNSYDCQRACDPPHRNLHTRSPGYYADASILDAKKPPVKQSRRHPQIIGIECAPTKLVFRG